jgi:hypothetical protein
MMRDGRMKGKVVKELNEGRGTSMLVRGRHEGKVILSFLQNHYSWQIAQTYTILYKQYSYCKVRLFEV